MNTNPPLGIVQEFAQTFGLYYQQMAELFGVHRTEIIRMASGTKTLSSPILRNTIEALLAIDKPTESVDWRASIMQAHFLLNQAYLEDLEKQLQRAKRRMPELEFQLEQQAEYYACDIRFLSTILFMLSIREALDQQTQERLEHVKQKFLSRAKGTRFNRYCNRLKHLRYLQAEIQIMEELLSYQPNHDTNAIGRR